MYAAIRMPLPADGVIGRPRGCLAARFLSHSCREVLRGGVSRCLGKTHSLDGSLAQQRRHKALQRVESLDNKVR